MSTTTNHDMIEELAATLDYVARQLVEALGDIYEVDPDDLVTELAGSPASAQQMMAALEAIDELAGQAAELRANLQGMGF